MTMISVAYWTIAGLITAWSAGVIWLAFFSPARSTLYKERRERWEDARREAINVRPFDYYPRNPERHVDPTSVSLGTPSPN